MKRTRAIFELQGNPTLTQLVANKINSFKAVEVIDEASPKRLNEVLSKNKSAIICSKSETSQFAPLYQAIVINVTTDKNIKGNVINVEGNNIVRKFLAIANKYNIDIGDHIMDDERQVGRNQDCFFCSLFEGKFKERIRVYESENFLVVPGKGAFYNGYFMILPRKHIMSFAELTSEEQKELLTVIEDITYILKQMYNKNILFWENGSGKSGQSKSATSIVHAHGHLMPISSNYNVLEDSFINGVPLSPIKETELSKYAEQPYLLVLNPTDNCWYIKTSNSHYIPRQFIRQLLCENLLDDDKFWDWRVYPFWSQVDENANEFISFVKANFSNLPERIQERTVKFIS